MQIGNTSLCETEDTYPLTQPYVIRLADLYPPLCKRDEISICIVLPSGRAKGHGGTSTFPLCPLDSFTPSPTGAAALDPGLQAKCASSPETRTRSGRGDDTARGFG